jgi:hypothetical protein
MAAARVGMGAQGLVASQLGRSGLGSGLQARGSPRLPLAPGVFKGGVTSQISL